MTVRYVPGQNWDMGLGPTWTGRDSPYMPQIQPNPEFENFYDQQRQAGNDFPSIMDSWQQQQQPVQQAPQMDRTAFRDAWLSAGQMSPQQADEWMRSHGATQVGGGEKAGRWQVPGGDVLDTQIGRGHALATGGMITPGWTATGIPQWAAGQGQQQPQWGGGGFGWGRLGGGGWQNMGGWNQGQRPQFNPGYMQNMQHQMWQRGQQQRQQPQRGGGIGPSQGMQPQTAQQSYNQHMQQKQKPVGGGYNPQQPRPQQQMQQPKYW